MDFQNDASLYLGNASSSQTYFEWIKSITWQTWLVVIIVLAILGFNIFYYLAVGTQDIHNMFSPVLSFFGKTAAGTTQQVVNTAAVGITGTTNAVASTINSGLQGSALQSKTLQNSNNSFADALNTAGLTSVQDYNGLMNDGSMKQEQEQDIEPDQATSSFNKEDWCYIGEEKGYRSCAQVGVNDKCMSGDIFPTMDICINPNLRQ